MDRLRAIELFVAIADSGSFAKAANKLRMSPPAVTRAVASLEERLGARLLNRTTRSLSLTQAGIHFLDSARRTESSLITRRIPSSAAFTASPRNAVMCA